MAKCEAGKVKAVRVKAKAAAAKAQDPVWEELKAGWARRIATGRPGKRLPPVPPERREEFIEFVCTVIGATTPEEIRTVRKGLEAEWRGRRSVPTKAELKAMTLTELLDAVVAVI